MSDWWQYENLERRAPYDWHPASRNNHPDDQIDFHVDLGAGKLPKGRLAIDRHGEADILMDLNSLYMYKFGEELRPKSLTFDGLGNPYKGSEIWAQRRLPFPDDSIESMISHHCLEHIGTGFLRLMDECHRVLKPGGKFRIIVPLFPSLAAVSDPDHVRYFTKDTFDSFAGKTGKPFWSDVFAEPYTKARYKITSKNYTSPQTINGPIDIDKLFKEPREIRVTLEKQ